MNEVQDKGNSLLKKWLDGDLTRQEERELEQLAKGDPMLADALAGLYAFSEKDHTAKISRLKKQLKKVTQEKLVRRIFFLPRVAVVAAAAAIIGGLAFGMWYFLENKRTSQHLAVESQQLPNLKTKDQQDATLDLQDKSAITRVETPSASEQQRRTINSQKKEQPGIAQSKPEETLVRATDIPATSTQVDAAVEVPTVQTEKEDTRSVEGAVASPEAAKPQAPTKKLQPSDNQLTFSNPVGNNRPISGQVTDAAKVPLIGATVSVKGTTIGTVTDIGGNFSLAVPMDASVLVISCTGYLSQEIRLGQNTSIQVAMDVNTSALNEVVTTGYGNNRKLQKEQAIAAPQPVGGFKKMERYIRRNLNYPAAAKEAAVQGAVVVNFRIEADGSLRDFKVEQSLGYGCDEEAIRLLREGPKWQLRSLIIRQDSASYTVDFSFKK